MSEQTPTNRLIRVFVSSTFRDMDAERDELIKRVFPRLRKLCEERFVHFQGIDLRWGITEEQSLRGEVVPICLEMIKRCEPYFIGILGERYGSPPMTIQPEALAGKEWVTEDPSKSITELEVLHGVLHDPRMCERTYFYFRDPSYLDRLPEGKDRSDFESESPQHSKRLNCLKDQIRRSGVVVREDYRDPIDFAELVYEDFKALIDTLYPLDKVPTSLERERNEHEAYASRRREVYIGRQDYFDRLDEYAKNGGSPIVITGASGLGKSALLANWVELYKQRNPDVFVIEHYIGSSSYASDWSKLVGRICGELKERYSLSMALPVKQEEYRNALMEWFAETATHGRILLVIDGLNNLEDRDAAHELNWLPRVYPPNVRVVSSSLVCRSLDAIAERNWSLMELTSLSKEERIQLIEDYLSLQNKRMARAHLDRIAVSDAASNPLYLTALLGELCVSAVHLTLSAVLDEYLSASDPGELYCRILERWERDYEREAPGLVRNTMRYIWASRRGLSESELLDLLGRSGKQLPAAIWSPLYLAAENALSWRSGRLALGHDYIRRAIESKWLCNTKDCELAHRELADYFESKERSVRKLEELPFQLRESKESGRLRDCLSDIDNAVMMIEQNEYELLSFWLGLNSREEMAEQYLRSFENWHPSDNNELTRARNLGRTGCYLNTSACYSQSESLLRNSLSIHEQSLGSNHPDVATSLNNLAILLYAKGDHVGAESHHRRAISIREKVLDPNNPEYAESLNNYAMLFDKIGDYSRAESLYIQSLSIYEEALGSDHPDVATILNNLALHLKTLGDYSSAEPLNQRALSIREKALGPYHPDVAMSLNNLAELLFAKGDYDGAKPLYRRALSIYEKALGPDHPSVATSLNNLANLLSAKGDYAGAEPLYVRALGIYEKVLGPDHPDIATSLNNLANLLSAKGDYAGAEPLYVRALGIYEKVLGPDHPDIATSLNNLGFIQYSKGDYAGAEPLYRRALSIYEKALGPDHAYVATSLNNLALLLSAKGDYAGAEPLYRRVLGIYEKALCPDHPDVATSLNNLANLLYAKGDYAGAELLYRRALGIYEKSLDPDHSSVATILNNLGFIQYSKGDYAGTEPLYRRALGIREKALGPDHPDVAASLNNLAELLRAKGDYAGAEPLCRRALGIREKALGPDHPDVASILNNLAELLKAKGDYAGTEPLYRRALGIREKALGPDHPDVATSLNNLALLLSDKGDYAGAEPLYRRALSIYEKALGPDHPSVATSLNNLANLLYAKDDYAGAESLFRRALSIREKAFGYYHSEVANSIMDIAKLLHAKGDFVNAEPMHRKALSIREIALGSDHPAVAGSLYNLAALLKDCGDLAGAEPMLRRALEIMEKRNLIDHPDTKQLINSLASTLTALGKHAESQEIKDKYGVS